MCRKALIKYITLMFLFLPGIVAYPLGFNVNEMKGNKLYKSANYEGAVKEYTEGLSGRADFNLYYNRGASYYKLGNYEKALSDFEDAATYANSTNGQEKAIFNAGNSSFMKAETEKTKAPANAIDSYGKAVKHFERVLELDTENQDAAYNLELARLRMDTLKKQQNKNQQGMDKQGQDQQNKDQQGKGQQSKGQQGQSQQEQSQQNKDQQGKGQQGQSQQNSNQQKPDDNSQTVSALKNVTPEDILNEETRRKNEAQLLLQNGSTESVDKDW